MREVQVMCHELARAGVSFEKKNPVTSLMSDVQSGDIREDVLNEKVLSAIVEIKVPAEQVEEILRLTQKVRTQIKTVISVGVGVRCDAEGKDRIVGPILERLGQDLVRAKTNLGLGRTATVGEPLRTLVKQ
jgi:hypothetical protein